MANLRGVQFGRSLSETPKPDHFKLIASSMVKRMWIIHTKLHANEHTHDSEWDRCAKNVRWTSKYGKLQRKKVNPRREWALQIQQMPVRSLRFRSVFTLRSLSIYRAHTRFTEGETKGCAFTGRKKRESKFKNNRMLLLIRVERPQTLSTAILCIGAWWRRLCAAWHWPRCATGVKWGNRHCHSLCFDSPRTKTMATVFTSNKAGKPTELVHCFLLNLHRFGNKEQEQNANYCYTSSYN